MNPWLETAGVVLVGLLGWSLGGRLRCWRMGCWILGYAFSLSVLVLLAFSRQGSALHFTPPFSWIVAGRWRLGVLALVICLGTSILVPRLPRAWEKVVVCVFMAVLLIWSSILPVLTPALLARHLADIENTIDANGVCLQTTQYTCGPAAAVTALRKLGLSASEGQLAILSHASPVTGTLPASLCHALRDRYASEGLECRYRPFRSIAELADSGLTLAVVKDAFLLDHCVAILDVSEKTVTVADPSSGIRAIPRAQFEAIWRFCGIVLSRSETVSQPG